MNSPRLSPPSRAAGLLAAAVPCLLLAGCAAVVTRPLTQDPLRPVPVRNDDEAARIKRGEKSGPGMPVPFVRSIDPEIKSQPGLARQIEGDAPQRLVTPGIPYFLPKGLLEIALTSLKDDKGRHKDFVLKSTPRLVPDPRAAFVIDSSRNALFTRDHTFKVKDGLLTSVTTSDAGKAGEVLTTLLSTVLNAVASHSAGVAFHGRGDPGPDPAADELLDLYSLILVGEHSFVFADGEFFKPTSAPAVLTAATNLAGALRTTGTEGGLLAAATAEARKAAAAFDAARAEVDQAQKTLDAATQAAAADPNNSSLAQAVDAARQTLIAKTNAAQQASADLARANGDVATRTAALGAANTDVAAKIAAAAAVAARQKAAGLYDIPGTGGRLKIKLTATEEPGALQNLPAPTKQEALVQTEFAGLYARVLRPVRYEVALVVDRLLLYAQRAEALPEKYNANLKAIAASSLQIEALAANIKVQRDLAKSYQDAATDLAKSPANPATPINPAAPLAVNSYLDLAKTAREAAATLTAQKAALEKAKAALEEENAAIGATDDLGQRYQNRVRLQNFTTGDLYATALTRGTTTMLPDPRMVAQIPLTRSPLGASKNAVTLDSGVVTEVHTEQPAVVLEAVKVLYSMVDSLIALPTRIIQLRIDYAGKQKELAAAEKARDEAVKALADFNKVPAPAAAPTAHQLELKALQEEKAIATLKAEIAELQAAITRATTQPLKPPHHGGRHDDDGR